MLVVYGCKIKGETDAARCATCDAYEPKSNAETQP